MSTHAWTPQHCVMWSAGPANASPYSMCSAALPMTEVSPVIQPQHVGLGQGRQEVPRASSACRHGQCVEEPGEPEGARGPAVAACLLAPGTPQPGLPNACRPGAEDMVTFPHPWAGGESGHEGLVSSPWGPRVDSFTASRRAQLGLAPARGQAPVFTLRACAVDEAPHALREGEGHHGRHLALLAEGLRQARAAPALECVEGGLREPDGSPLSAC
jgi:hypothetical protein